MDVQLFRKPADRKEAPFSKKDFNLEKTNDMKCEFIQTG